MLLLCLYILCKGPFPSLFVYLGSRGRRLVLLVLMFPLMIPKRPRSATAPGLAHPPRIPPASPSPNCLNFPLPQWRTRCLLVSPWQAGRRNTDLPQAFSNFVLRAIQSLILSHSWEPTRLRRHSNSPNFAQPGSESLFSFTGLPLTRGRNSPWCTILFSFF